VIPLSPYEKKHLLEWMHETFGINIKKLGNLVLSRHGKDIWMSTPQTLEPSIPHITRVGMRLVRKDQQGYKLTTPAIQLLGAHATKRVIEISHQEAERFIRGEDLILPDHPAIPQGQVIVRIQGRPLGSGLWKNNRLKNQVPVAHRVRKSLEPFVKEDPSSSEKERETTQ